MALFGVYVHVPFCTRRCDYCAFATWADRHHLMARYVAACRREIRAAGLPAASSIFFGGGTPSLLPAGLLVSVLEAIERDPDAEVTVECNPETITPSLVTAYCRAGVTRLSFGAQSMVPHVLASLGRDHDPAAVVRALGWAREAGIPSVSVDLIFGAATETVEDWRRSLAAVLALEPDHVSAYALTVELGTPLARQAERWPDDDDQAEKYALADQMLEAAGHRWYEVSNWARPGQRCRHNLLYWAQGDYRGVGCAAHSHAAGRRWWNARTPERYIDRIEAGQPPVAGEEVLTREQRRLEELQLALRTAEGVPDTALPRAFTSPGAALEGLIQRAGARASLTLRGRLLANEVSARLVVPSLPAAPARLAVAIGTSPGDRAG